MIHWAWLIAAFILGTILGGWVESLSDRKVRKGAALGIIGTLLVLLGLN